MKSFLVWLPALALYAIFLGWYVNWSGPVQPVEVAALMERLESSGAGGIDRNNLGTMRKFLEADDGREFFMVNLVRLAPGNVADPVTGAQRPARQVAEGYSRVFMPALLARGGHQAILARKVGGYLDAWGVDPDPGWTVMGYIRYRSRRDLALLASDPQFGPSHKFKFAAIAQTYAFPSQPLVLALLSPKIWVGLALALVAAMTQIVWLLRLKS
jgi:hypothetical protein